VEATPTAAVAGMRARWWGAIVATAAGPPIPAPQAGGGVRDPGRPDDGEDLGDDDDEDQPGYRR
jgi:hypothetical protein